jgi:hypothetical protein
MLNTIIVIPQSRGSGVGWSAESEILSRVVVGTYSLRRPFRLLMHGIFYCQPPAFRRALANT